MLRVLVTGSSGFIGGAILRRLHASHTVVGLSRRPSPHAHLSVEHDLGTGDIAPIVRAIEPCGVIVHAAAELHIDPLNLSVVRTNTIGTMSVLALASAWHAYVVYLSSIQVIGRPVSLPITEEHRAAPRTTYHATKLFGEHILAATGVPAAALRLTSPVGPGMPDDRILAVFARRAARGEAVMVAGEGRRTQDYVHVEDVAEAVAACLERRVSGVYNVGAGVSVTNLDLAHLCVRTLGSPSRIELTGTPDPEEQARWEVDIQKAREALGYDPEPNLPAVIRALAGDVRA